MRKRLAEIRMVRSSTNSPFSAHIAPAPVQRSRAAQRLDATDPKAFAPVVEATTIENKSGIWELRGVGSKYDGIKVLDVHSHVVRPSTTYLFATSMLASNAARPSPISSGTGHDPAREEEYKAEADKHVAHLEERNIDVQVGFPSPSTVIRHALSEGETPAASQLP